MDDYIPNPRKVDEVKELASDLLQQLATDSLTDEACDALVTAMTLNQLHEVDTIHGRATLLATGQLSLTLYHSAPPLTEAEEKMLNAPFEQRPEPKSVTELQHSILQLALNTIFSDLRLEMQRAFKAKDDVTFELSDALVKLLSDSKWLDLETGVDVTDDVIWAKITIDGDGVKVKVAGETIFTYNQFGGESTKFINPISNLHIAHRIFSEEIEEAVENLTIHQMANNTRVTKLTLDDGDYIKVKRLGERIRNSIFSTYSYDSPYFDFEVHEDGMLEIGAHGYTTLQLQLS